MQFTVLKVQEHGAGFYLALVKTSWWIKSQRWEHGRDHMVRKETKEREGDSSFYRNPLAKSYANYINSF
jgi:hypothetical protein